MFKSYLRTLHPFQPSATFHIETNHLICSSNQMTGFYMKCNIGLKWGLNGLTHFKSTRLRCVCVCACVGGSRGAGDGDVKYEKYIRKKPSPIYLYYVFYAENLLKYSKKYNELIHLTSTKSFLYLFPFKVLRMTRIVWRLPCKVVWVTLFPGLF